MHAQTLPLKELKRGTQIYRIVDVQAVVATKHQADGSDEVGDLVVHNLAVYAEHELPCSIAAVSCKEQHISYYHSIVQTKCFE